MEFRIFRALGLAFRVWFRNFLPFTVVAVTVLAPVFLWVLTVDLDTASIDEINAKLFRWPIYLAVAAGTLVSPFLTYRIIEDLNGTKVPMVASLRHGLRGLIPALIVAVVVNALSFLPGAGIVAAIVFCIWFVAAPAAVAEKLGPWDALQRSAVLTSGRRPGIFGLNLLLAVVQVALVFGVINPMIENPGADYLASFRQTSVLIVCVFGAIQTFRGVVAAVSYALLRQDKDGVSHEQLARVFE